MAQLDTNDGGGGKKKKGGSKQKKASMHVDFTPMVDMNMLLITFFMLCTSLSKPQTMEIVMPTNKDVKEDQQSAVKASQAVTVLCTGGDSIYYYEGQPKYEDYNTLKETTYAPDGLRKFLLSKNYAVVSKIKELKKKKENLELDEVNYRKQVDELKNGKNTPTVIIKATDEATYKNMIDVLDEMAICNIGKYVIVKIEPGDRRLIANKRSKGAYSANVAK